MKIVNTLKFSADNISPLGVGLATMYLAGGVLALKIGAQALLHSTGFRGSITVFK